MNRLYVDFDTIRKRSRCLSSDTKGMNCTLLSERAKVPGDKNAVSKFFNECQNTKNANAYVEECMDIISEYARTDEATATRFAQKYVDSIMPYVENTHGFGRKDMPEEIYRLLETSAAKYRVCDRILSNHKKISKRFNMDSYVESSRYKSTDRVIIKCCEMIDTYDDIKPQAKMNICLEELYYLFNKHNLGLHGDKLVKYVTEYFLTRQSIIPGDVIRGYKNVLRENTVIKDSNIKQFGYFMEGEDDTSSVIIGLLHQFIASETKDIATDFAPIINNLTNEEVIPRSDFLGNFLRILNFIRFYLITDSYDFKEILDLISNIPNAISKLMSDDTWRYNKEEMDKVIDGYLATSHYLDQEIKAANAGDVSKQVAMKDCCTQCIEKLLTIRNMIYSEYNIECMYYTPALNESVSKIKFRNVLALAENCEKYIYKVIKTNKADTHMNFINNGYFIRDVKLEEAVAGDSLEIILKQFEVIDFSVFRAMNNTIEELCKTLNKTILDNTGFKSYHTYDGYRFIIMMTGGIDTLVESVEVEDNFTTSEMMNIVQLDQTASVFDGFDMDQISHITDIVKDKVSDPNFTKDQLSLVKELAEVSGVIDSEDMEEIYRRFSLTHDITKYEPGVDIEKEFNRTTLEMQLEACNLILAICESDKEKQAAEDARKAAKDRHMKFNNGIETSVSSGNKKRDKKKLEIKNPLPSVDKKGDNKTEIKNPFAGIKFNDLKLAAAGMKKEIKNLSSKEQNFCRNLDMEVSRLANNTRDALTNNRREAIIKGSVIPSFSRCCKYGIALAGSALVNPILPVIVFLGGFAISKHLNKKERLLLLDEIETELEVVEKEIQMAESRDQIKRYRELLKYKKELQRQYQRIRYNIRIGKDLMPNSNTGLREQ